MKKLLFSYFLCIFLEYNCSNAILKDAQSFHEYQIALRDFYDILEECRENHLIRKSFICYAKYNIFREEYLTEIPPCYLEQLVYKFRCLLNFFANHPSQENLQEFTNTANYLKNECHHEMDDIIRRFR